MAAGRRARLRYRGDRVVRSRVRLRVREPDPVGADPRGRRGGASLRDPRRCARARRAAAVPRVRRVVARRPLRPARVHRRSRHVPVRRLPDHRPDLRLARRRLARESEPRVRRAAEAERLRDELGRRVDLLEAANRCARALASSLDPRRRSARSSASCAASSRSTAMAIVLAEEGDARGGDRRARRRTTLPGRTRGCRAGSCSRRCSHGRRQSTGAT